MSDLNDRQIRRESVFSPQDDRMPMSTPRRDILRKNAVDHGFPCGRCGTPTDFETREYCSFCFADLCPTCWRELGHCDHEEMRGKIDRTIRAYTANKREERRNNAIRALRGE